MLPECAASALVASSSALVARAERGPSGPPSAWGLLLMLGLVGSAAGSFTAAATVVGLGSGQVLALGAVQLLGALVLGGTCWRSGRPRQEERAQRLAYADSLGDAAALQARDPDEATALKLQLRHRLRERARALPGWAYRGGPDAEGEWQALALDPRVEDLPFLKAALTLTRLEERRQRGVKRARLRAVHQAIWRRLRALDPSMLAAVRYL